MHAIVCPRYGPPEVLQSSELDKPTPKEREVLIRIHAAIATPADCAFRQANPFFVRFMYGLLRPRFPVLGVEFSGEVEAAGRAVTRFRPGDQVFGLSVDGFGTYAEYKCLPEDKLVALKPPSVSHATAVALCDGATTALTFLRDRAKVQPGQHVLINGASGSVGAAAVQLAKHYRAQVTGVCSAANAELVLSLGADRVVDYTSQDFTAGDARYDVILDAVGKSSFSHCKQALTPTGVYLTTVPSLTVMLQMLWTRNSAGKRAIFAASGLEQTRENLEFVMSLVESGVMKPLIDRQIPLAQLAEAHRYVETGHKKGSVVITVGPR